MFGEWEEIGEPEGNRTEAEHVNSKQKGSGPESNLGLCKISACFIKSPITCWSTSNRWPHTNAGIWLTTSINLEAIRADAESVCGADNRPQNLNITLQQPDHLFFSFASTEDTEGGCSEFEGETKIHHLINRKWFVLVLTLPQCFLNFSFTAGGWREGAVFFDEEWISVYTDNLWQHEASQQTQAPHQSQMFAVSLHTRTHTQDTMKACYCRELPVRHVCTGIYILGALPLFVSQV